MKSKTSFILTLAVFIAAGPAFSKAKAVKTPTPVPKPAAKASPNLAAMQKALRFWVYEKSSDVVNDVTGIFDNKAQKIILKCELKNQTAKEIHGVRGTLRFTTYFGDVIADIAIETQLPIPAGQVLGVNWEVPTERLTPEAFDKLKKAKMEQMKQVWYPRMIVFTDGTALK
jgi:hypothetical protein